MCVFILNLFIWFLLNLYFCWFWFWPLFLILYLLFFSSSFNFIYRCRKIWHVSKVLFILYFLLRSKTTIADQEIIIIIFFIKSEMLCAWTIDSNWSKDSEYDSIIGCTPAPVIIPGYFLEDLILPVSNSPTHTRTRVWLYAHTNTLLLSAM